VDYFQGVVGEFLRADRSCFVNPEFWLRGNLAKDKAYQKPHWYVDVLAAHMRHRCVYLCEVTYSKQPNKLLERLKNWHDRWDIIVETLKVDAAIPADWPVKVWIFAPEGILASIRPSILAIHPTARFTNLEDILPWLYCTWDRKDEQTDELPPPELRHPM
jgi:hypothetical protein